MMTGQPVNEQRAERFRQGMEQALDHLESVWLRDAPYLAGQQISVADLLAACELEQPSESCPALTLTLTLSHTLTHTHTHMVDATLCNMWEWLSGRQCGTLFGLRSRASVRDAALTAE